MISPYVISVSVHKDGNVLQPATFEVVNKFFHRLSWRLIICEIEADTKIASLKEKIMSQHAENLGASILRRIVCVTSYEHLYFNGKPKTDLKTILTTVGIEIPSEFPIALSNFLKILSVFVVL